MRWKAPYFLISQDTRGSCPWGLKDSIAILCCCQRIEMMEAHQLVEMKYILFLVVVVHPNFLWVFGLCKLNKTFILFYTSFCFISTYQMTFVIVEDCKALKCLQISQKGSRKLKNWDSGHVAYSSLQRKPPGFVITSLDIWSKLITFQIFFFLLDNTFVVWCQIDTTPHYWNV